MDDDLLKQALVFIRKFEEALPYLQKLATRIEERLKEEKPL